MRLEETGDGSTITETTFAIAPKPERGSTAFRPDVEGLRAVAVVAVVLYHANISVISGGFVGVDIFFVISGFLITGILLSERERSAGISLLSFYARRIRRVLPAATVVLAVTVISSYWLVGVARAQSVAHDAYWAAVFLGNVHFSIAGVDYFNRGAAPSPLLHFWSLGVEEQFYLAWPLMMIVLGLSLHKISYRVKLGCFLAVAIGASLAWSIVQTSSNPSWAYFSPFTRAWELAAGAMVAVLLPSLARVPAVALRIASWIGLACIVVSIFVYDGATPFPGVAALLPVGGATLLIVGGSSFDPLGATALLGLPPVRYIGRISYSLYLWHWPVLVLLAGDLGHPLSTAVSLLAVAGAVVLSAITYAVVESPVRSSAFLRNRSRLVTVLFGIVMVGIVLAVSAIEIHVHQVSYHPSHQITNPVFP
jgi:peptidoglycan/LPS O-acetylase OafA/YrhL